MMLSPGDRINVVVGSQNGRPLYQSFTWEEIHGLLVRKAKVRKDTNKPSRQVALLVRAIETGKWSTGADVSRTACWDKLICLVRDMADPTAMTPKAKAAICRLIAESPQYTSYANALQAALERGL